jgi:hypothetical protein
MVQGRGGGVERGDEADEGRLEALRGMVLGAFRGSVGIVSDSGRSRPSQLIPGVRRTKKDHGQDARDETQTA